MILYSVDFEYDGKKLSDFGYIICSFEQSSGPNVKDKGSEISFITSPIQSGLRFLNGGTKYEECLTTTFQICKDPSFFDTNEMEVSAEDFRRLSRWLNRRKFLWFRASDWCDPEKARPWVRASFTLGRIDVGNVTYGIELEMVTDSPFTYGDEITKTFTFTSNSLTASFKDENDEIGEFFPALKITCGQSGDLTISNSKTGCECSVDNCITGEVIEFSGDTKIISTTSPTHDIANDFNYSFYSIGNTYSDRVNDMTVSIPCTVEMTYRPIYKDTL